MKMFRSRKPIKCPKCKHEPMQTCVVGYPSEEDGRNPNIYCHGCIPAMPDIDGYSDANWHCENCDLFIWKRKTKKQELAWDKEKPKYFPRGDLSRFTEPTGFINAPD